MTKVRFGCVCVYVMALVLLRDAEKHPDAFQWLGAPPAGEVRRWAADKALFLPEDLVGLLEVTGGGDMFETETILSPFADPIMGDNVDVENETHRALGLPVNLWLFQRGAFLTAIDQAARDCCALYSNYNVMERYKTLDDWYVDLVRPEFADRYGLRSLSR